MNIIEFPAKKEESSLQIINDTPLYRIEILVDRGYEPMLVSSPGLPFASSSPLVMPMICPACNMAVNPDGEVHFKLSVFSKEDGSTTLLRYHLACYDAQLRNMFDEVLNANEKSKIQTKEIPGG